MKNLSSSLMASFFSFAIPGSLWLSVLHVQLGEGSEQWSRLRTYAYNYIKMHSNASFKIVLQSYYVPYSVQRNTEIQYVNINWPV